MTRVSSTCLVRADRNRYSVPAAFAGKVVSVRMTAQQVQVVGQGEVIADHGRVFGQDQLICDPWHYLSVLEKKPGALRNGAPFMNWALPEPIQQVRAQLLKQPKGDRAFVELLMAAQETELKALTVACERALEYGTVTAPVILNVLRRLTQAPRPAVLPLPDEIELHLEPRADCGRYDYLRGVPHVH
jgi:hypothetical protein